MADEITNPEGGAEAFTPEEQAAIQKGQEGLSEVDPNVVPERGPQRPANIPEKFWKDGKVDTDAMAASYAALEAKMGSGEDEQAPAGTEGQQQEAPAARADGKIEKVETPTEPEDATSPVTDAMEAARTEWAEGGELSEDSYSKLEAAGIPKSVVDLYLEGIKATTAKTMESIHGYVGGEDSYNSMLQWAAKSLNDAEIEAYNAALDDPALRENAVLGLNARFTRARPSEGKLVTPNDSGTAAADVFQNRDELIAAQKDARYKTDASYRQGVVDKLARSQRVGFQAFDRPRFRAKVLSN